MMRCLRNHYAIILGFTLMAIVIGCSDSSVDSYLPDSEALAYFPIQPGTGHNYTLTDNVNDLHSAQILSFGDPVYLGGHWSFPWVSFDPIFGQVVEQGYVYADGDAIYYFTPNSAPEKIIEAPFIAGRAWDRVAGLTDEQAREYNYSFLDTLIVGASDKYDLETGDGGDNGTKDYDDGNTDGGDLSLSTPLPVDNINTLKIRSISSDVELPGATFDNCLLIESKSGSLTNRYWYAPSVGLVKYELNIWEDYPNGELVGQLDE